MTEKVLNPKEESFCIHFTSIGADTLAHGTKSAIAAEYAESSAATQAWKLLKRPAIQERIAELHKDNCRRNLLSGDKILTDLEHTRLKALDKGELAVAARCSELQGKYFAMFVDRTVSMDDVEVAELDERQTAEAKRLATIRLREGIASRK